MRSLGRGLIRKASVFFIFYTNLCYCECVRKQKHELSLFFCLDRSKKLTILATLHAMHIRAIVLMIYTKCCLDCEGAVAVKLFSHHLTVAILGSALTPDIWQQRPSQR